MKNLNYYIFYCKNNKCGYIWHSDRIDTECPLCKSIDIRVQIDEEMYQKSKTEDDEEKKDK